MQPLAYLSLSEDQGPPAPWQRADRNPDWGGAFVYVGHPGWVEHVVGQARAALEAGFAGLFLDTLNVELTYPEDVPHLLDLIAALREEAGDAYILANRGFGMLPRLVELVDGDAVRVVLGAVDGRRICAVAAGRAGVPRRDRRAAAASSTSTCMRSTTPTAKGWPPSRPAGRRQFGLHSFISDRALSRV